MAASLGKLSNILSAETINILLSEDGGSDGVLRNMVWEGKLDKDAMDSMVIVLFVDLLQQLRLGNIRGEMNKFAMNASL